MELCLGTVQFGLNYGINNIRGKVPKQEVIDILNYAFDNGISVLDTASAYGESESVLGEVIPNIGKDFNIITKYPLNTEITPLEFIKTSLKKLRTKNIYGYLFHNYSIYKNNPNLIIDFIKIKEAGLSEKIGFSLYSPDEAEYILKNNIPCDIIQIPYNIFDQRFSYLLSALYSKGIDIYVRSVFLQGLFFKEPNTLDNKFISIKDKLIKLNSIAKQYSINITALCMSFAYFNKNIKSIVIGIDSLANLKENIHIFTLLKNLDIPSNIFNEFVVIDENIILPYNWSK